MVVAMADTRGNAAKASQQWAALIGRVRDIEQRSDVGGASRDVAGGTSRPLSAAATVGLGAIHEWFVMPADASKPTGRPPVAPICVLSHLAGRALEAEGGYVVWVGRRCWPYGRLLARGENRDLLERSIFVDAVNDASRLWAVDVALRCEAVCAVIADGTGLDMPATRRLQLAARAGRSVGLLARPPAELRGLSAAATRWIVTAVANHQSHHPRWRVRQIRSKGGPYRMWGGDGGRLSHAGHDGRRDTADFRDPTSDIEHLLEFCGAQGAIHLLADVADRPAATARKKARRQTA